MIIPNNFIKLDYNPVGDYLFIEWPNMLSYSQPELKFILEEVVTTVKHYDIKRILTDSTKSTVTMSNEDYAHLINNLALMLASTRLEKFARLTTFELNRETIASNASELVKDKIQYQTFDNLEVAIAWLTS